MRSATRRTSHLLPLFGFLATVAALHFAKGLLVPIALAALLSLLLCPLAKRLERFGLRPAVAVTATVLFALLLFASFAGLLMSQVSDLAERLPQYRSNIVAKSESLGPVGEEVTRTYTAFQRLGEEIVSSTHTTPPPQHAPEVPSVQIVEAPVGPMQAVRGVFVSGAEAIGTAIVVLILIVFLLVYRRDLGDRFVHVFGRTNVHLTSQAMADAAENVSQYLVTLAMVNGMFGLVVTFGLFALGVPNAVLWGFLAAFLRFIPYVGVWIGLVMPLLLSLAVFKSWTPPLVLFVSWLLLEIVTANVVEPWLYGKRTAVSPLGVMLGALFWTWLWGPAGLVLAVPMTVSVFVVARTTPQLAFLDTLFGSTAALEPKVQVYHRLLGLDPDAAVALVAEFGKDKPIVEVCDTLLVPALALAEADRHRGDLEDDRGAALVENMRSVIEEIEHASAKKEPERVAAEAISGTPAAADTERTPVLVIPAADDADELVASMLRACLAKSGIAADCVPAAATPDERAERASGHAGVVCISAVPPSAAAPARHLCSRIRSRRPGARIVVGVWTATNDLVTLKDRIAPDGRTRIVATLADALAEIEKLSGPAPSGRGAAVTAARAPTLR